MGLADVHAHLTHPELRGDLDTILAKAESVGVSTILVNGLNPRDNEAARELAKTYPQIKAAFGFYPIDAVLPEMRALGTDYPREGEECTAADGLQWLQAHAAEAFAIGEIGLDGYWVPEALWESQETVFRQAVEIAMEHDMLWGESEACPPNCRARTLVVDPGECASVGEFHADAGNPAAGEDSARNGLSLSLTRSHAAEWPRGYRWYSELCRRVVGDIGRRRDLPPDRKL